MEYDIITGTDREVKGRLNYLLETHSITIEAMVSSEGRIIILISKTLNG